MLLSNRNGSLTGDVAEACANGYISSQASSVGACHQSWDLPGLFFPPLPVCMPWS